MEKLPIEIIENILLNCSFSSLKSLRLVNKFFNSKLQSILLSKVKFNDDLIKFNKLNLIKHLNCLCFTSINDLISILHYFTQLKSVTLNPHVATLLFEDPQLG